ncbi:MAG: GNAT family N-acetyltransferase, partial [Pseudomonadota bacterium]
MSIRHMSLNDLEMVLEWAAAEGWNPGLEDATAFFAADPEGFFLKEVGGTPVAAISVVNHDERFAFLGLYICRPDHRGAGHGMEVWRAGLSHAGPRCIGLDGVPDQQANYARSGFRRHGRTVRLSGSVARGAKLTSPPDLTQLSRADAQATGIERSRFMGQWFRETATRKTRAVIGTDGGPAFATYRKCRDGIKVGPFHAHSLTEAEALLAGVPSELGDGPLIVDVPDSSEVLQD